MQKHPAFKRLKEQLSSPNFEDQLNEAFQNLSFCASKEAASLVEKFGTRQVRSETSLSEPLVSWWTAVIGKAMVSLADVDVDYQYSLAFTAFHLIFKGMKEGFVNEKLVDWMAALAQPHDDKRFLSVLENAVKNFTRRACSLVTKDSSSMTQLPVLNRNWLVLQQVYLKKLPSVENASRLREVLEMVSKWAIHLQHHSKELKAASSEVLFSLQEAIQSLSDMLRKVIVYPSLFVVTEKHPDPLKELLTPLIEIETLSNTLSRDDSGVELMRACKSIWSSLLEVIDAADAKNLCGNLRTTLALRIHVELFENVDELNNAVTVASRATRSLSEAATGVLKSLDLFNRCLGTEPVTQVIGKVLDFWCEFHKDRRNPVPMSTASEVVLLHKVFLRMREVLASGAVSNPFTSLCWMYLSLCERLYADRNPTVEEDETRLRLMETLKELLCCPGSRFTKQKLKAANLIVSVTTLLLWKDTSRTDVSVKSARIAWELMKEAFKEEGFRDSCGKKEFLAILNYAAILKLVGNFEETLPLIPVALQFEDTASIGQLAALWTDIKEDAVKQGRAEFRTLTLADVVERVACDESFPGLDVSNSALEQALDYEFFVALEKWYEKPHCITMKERLVRCYYALYYWESQLLQREIQSQMSARKLIPLRLSEDKPPGDKRDRDTSDTVPSYYHLTLANELDLLAKTLDKARTLSQSIVEACVISSEDGAFIGDPSLFESMLVTLYLTFRLRGYDSKARDIAQCMLTLFRSEKYGSCVTVTGFSAIAAFFPESVPELLKSLDQKQLRPSELREAMLFHLTVAEEQMRRLQLEEGLSSILKTKYLMRTSKQDQSSTVVATISSLLALYLWLGGADVRSTITEDEDIDQQIALGAERVMFLAVRRIYSLTVGVLDPANGKSPGHFGHMFSKFVHLTRDATRLFLHVAATQTVYMCAKEPILIAQRMGLALQTAVLMAPLLKGDFMASELGDAAVKIRGICHVVSGPISRDEIIYDPEKHDERSADMGIMDYVSDVRGEEFPGATSCSVEARKSSRMSTLSSSLEDARCTTNTRMEFGAIEVSGSHSPETSSPQLALKTRRFFKWERFENPSAEIDNLGSPVLSKPKEPDFAKLLVSGTEKPQDVKRVVASLLLEQVKYLIAKDDLKLANTNFSRLWHFLKEISPEDRDENFDELYLEARSVRVDLHRNDEKLRILLQSANRQFAYKAFEDLVKVPWGISFVAKTVYRDAAELCIKRQEASQFTNRWLRYVEKRTEYIAALEGKTPAKKIPPSRQPPSTSESDQPASSQNTKDLEESPAPAATGAIPVINVVEAAPDLFVTPPNVAAISVTPQPPPKQKKNWTATKRKKPVPMQKQIYYSGFGLKEYP
ncbi:unnamed protein product [Cyprideis torosa]|uniref:Uncharacterized protein n=1 Tax=Cyprideis torosa TaxID=163714 RepID=A0A7R8ZM50_9CRUS|nr:unnamed protein product [Cyprideis torosa]CAG0885052.1 unnamed protein product [Cyprideis torosa]